ncbi:MAG: hypothetical protein GXP63_04865 [DPANN group archaeon]|nr:hypothetical protein [DPANN group archaeon]
MSRFREAVAFVDRKDILLIFVIFLAGFVTASLLPINALESPAQIPGISDLVGPGEVASPKDWIPEKDIHVYNDRVIIDVKNPEWAAFTDTNSMDPVFDKGSNAIEIVPTSSEQVTPGEIVSYQSRYASGTIIHRVKETGQDEDGWYAIMQGDNNPRPDPGKVRFDQIRRLVVAIIY